jgi:predicted nucleic acid-binding protein
LPLDLYLTDLINRGFEFALSGITIYELMRGLSIKKEKEISDFP